MSNGYTCEHCHGNYVGPHQCPVLHGIAPAPRDPFRDVLAQDHIITCKDCGELIHTTLGTFPHKCNKPLSLKDKLRGQKAVKKATVTQ